MSAAASEIVALIGGPSVPLVAVSLLLSLEARGFSIREDGADLLVAPLSGLTTEDRRGIRAYRDSLLALVRYCDTVRIE